jgi:hypothetical protein
MAESFNAADNALLANAFAEYEPMAPILDLTTRSSAFPASPSANASQISRAGWG